MTTVALAGSVGSSRRTLEALIRHDADVVGVLGLDASRADGVSDYARLDDLAEQASAAYRDFVRINAPEVIEQLRQWKPDVLFVVGLSQLVSLEVRQTARRGAVGFHPTRLPEGRGRAPIAWIILENVPAAATFFELEDEADAGGIFVQEPVPVAPDDHAAGVIAKVEAGIDRALDRWLPELLSGKWSPVAQDHTLATYFGVRRAEDGEIDWSRTTADILRLVRATTRPHPGAFTHVGQHRIVVRKASISDRRISGVLGRVLEGGHTPLVQAGDGVVVLEDWIIVGSENRPDLRTGVKLGDRLADLERRIELLEHLSESSSSADSPAGP
jgi:methionyl-tRNA formyltransferase